MITGRFAPTPSGRMHIGNAFSALIAWSYAKNCGGKMKLRIEDLDTRANSSDFAEMLIDDLGWLGLDWDGEILFQSKRICAYKEAFQKLLDKNLIYPCFCTRGELHVANAPHDSDGNYIYSGKCRNLTTEEVKKQSRIKAPCFRIKVPDSKVEFDDLIYDHKTYSLTDEVGDFIVRRSDGIFAYQLAVVVDDAFQGVTQVARGRDLLSSCAKQIYLHDMLDLPHVKYLHIPLLMATDGHRLSKRNRDIDFGYIRSKNSKPYKLIGQLAYYLGIANKNEELNANEFASRLTLDVLKAHKDDIVVR